LLSRTVMQHRAGTRAALDFVEMASTLFEHFAWHPDVVGRFARHHTTGEPLPPDVLHQLHQQKHLFEALNTQVCTMSLSSVHSLFDMGMCSSDVCMACSTQGCGAMRA